MSDIVLNKAAECAPPYGDGVNPTTVREFTSDSTSRNTILPDAWAGQYVTVRAVTADVRWFISKNSAATCDETEGTDIDGNPEIDHGKLFPAGYERDYRLPIIAPGEHLYLVRASVLAASLEMVLSSY